MAQSDIAEKAESRWTNPAERAIFIAKKLKPFIERKSL